MTNKPYTKIRWIIKSFSEKKEFPYDFLYPIYLNNFASNADFEIVDSEYRQHYVNFCKRQQYVKIGFGFGACSFT